MVAAAVIRRGDLILLVREQNAAERATWALPGGRMEPGEVMHETLERRVRDETGLAVEHVGFLAYLTQVETLAESSPRTGTLTCVFEARASPGDPAPDTLDDQALDARFYTQVQALDRVEAMSQRSMREPLAAYLRGEAPAGSIWQYRREEEGDRLVLRTPEPREVPAGVRSRQRGSPRDSMNAQEARQYSLFVLGCLAVLACLAIVVIIGVITLVAR